MNTESRLSVEGRDLGFETAIMNRFYGEYVQKYVDLISRMDKVKSFVLA